MAKKRTKMLIKWSQWLSMTLVGLGVGFAAVNGTLSIPAVSETIMMVAGWVVVVTTLIGAGNEVMKAM